MIDAAEVGDSGGLRQRSKGVNVVKAGLFFAEPEPGQKYVGAGKILLPLETSNAERNYPMINQGGTFFSYDLGAGDEEWTAVRFHCQTPPASVAHDTLITYFSPSTPS